MPDVDDIALLREFVNNHSESAFATIVQRRVNLVYSVALRLTGNSEDAQDVTQAVFVILARKAAGLRPKTVLTGWLYETTRFAAMNLLTRNNRRQRREQEAYMQSTLNDAETVWPQLAPLLESAMSRLNEKDRTLVALRFYENRSMAETAVVLGVNESAARKRTERVMEKLRAYFSKRGVNSTADTIAGAISANSIQTAPAVLAKTVTVVALAKGAAASTSTLTLVKGALKVMAWTKVKTTIITGVAVLLALGGVTVAVKTISTARTKAALATMQGNWEGVLNAGPTRLRLVLKIFETNGNYRAAIDSIDQGTQNIPVARLFARPDSIDARLPALDAEFKATLKQNSTEMSGRWQQLKRSYPLTLKRTAIPTTVATEMPTEDYARRSGSDLQGAWEGTLKVGNASLRLRLRIAEPTPGTFRAQMDSVDQGVRNLPVTSVTYQNPMVRFVISPINGHFEGRVNGQDDQIVGTWTQAGKKLPLTFQRAATNDQTTANTQLDYGNGNPYQLQGHWKGVLKVNGLALHIVFHIAQTSDGSYSATLDSPDQGAAGIPATDVLVTYPNVKLEWKGIEGVFTGKVTHGTLSGTWRQGKTDLPLQLEKSTAK